MSLNLLKFLEIQQNADIFENRKMLFFNFGKIKLLFFKNPKIFVFFFFFFFFLVRRHLCIYVAYMCTLFPGGIEPQPIKLEFTIYPAELWIWGGAGEGSEHNRTFWPRLHMFWPLLHVGEG